MLFFLSLDFTEISGFLKVFIEAFFDEIKIHSYFLKPLII